MGQSGQEEDLSRPGRGLESAGRAPRPQVLPLSWCGKAPRRFFSGDWDHAGPGQVLLWVPRPLPSLPGRVQSTGVETLLSRGSSYGRGCTGQGVWGRPSW